MHQLLKRKGEFPFAKVRRQEFYHGALHETLEDQDKNKNEQKAHEKADTQTPNTNRTSHHKSKNTPPSTSPRSAKSQS